MIGQVLGQYRIVAELGHGSMGEVYRAVDEMLDRDVALKILRPELTHDSELAERFRREAITLARLDHQNIARLHGLIKHETKLLMVMEFVTGETLAGRLKRGRVPWRDAVDLIGQILAALDYAHSQGVVHRDIKPSNVMVRLDGRVKVMDFGIARVLGTARVTRVGHMIGTLEYMSPEQIRGEDVKASSDLYATGVLLYELLAGRMPFEGPTDAALIQQHLRGTVPPLNAAAVGAPVWFEAVVTRALAKTPGERFESAASFRAELDRLAATEATPAIKATRLSESPTTASDQQPPTRLAPVSPAPARPAPTPAGGHWRWTSRHLVVAAAILTLLVAMAIVFGLRRTTPDRPPTVASAPAEPQVTASLPTVVPTPEPQRAPDRPLTTPVPPAAKPAKAAGRGGTPLPPPSPEPAPPRADVPPPPTQPAPAPPPPPPVVEEKKAPVEKKEWPLKEFEDVSLVVESRDGAEEQPVILRLEPTRLVIIDADSSKPLRTLPYDAIVEGSYKQTQRRVVLVRTTQHWLTLKTASVTVLLRLDKDNYYEIIPLIEERTGLKIAR
jgi:serine/threonine protein kinase